MLLDEQEEAPFFGSSREGHCFVNPCFRKAQPVTALHSAPRAVDTTALGDVPEGCSKRQSATGKAGAPKMAHAPPQSTRCKTVSRDSALCCQDSPALGHAFVAPSGSQDTAWVWTPQLPPVLAQISTSMLVEWDCMQGRHDTSAECPKLVVRRARSQHEVTLVTEAATLVLVQKATCQIIFLTPLLLCLRHLDRVVTIACSRRQPAMADQDFARHSRDNLAEMSETAWLSNPPLVQVPARRTARRVMLQRRRRRMLEGSGAT